MSTPVIQIDGRYPEINKLTQAAMVIREGGLVVFPTETVYGIAADYRNSRAMNRLREVKKRGQDKPFSILISQMSSLPILTNYSSPALYKVIDKYWPGPLTVVVPGLEAGKTVGIRMPDHSIALNLVRESQTIVAAPSANFENNPAPTTCQEALRDLDGLVDLAIDGGPSRYGVSSSVVDFATENPKVIREGVITQADIDRIVNKKTVLFVCTGNSCRSVMAEYLLRNMLGAREDVEVASAGTGVFIRSGASSETIHMLARMGMDASFHQSQPVNSVLLRKSDLIVVMTNAHRQQILDRVPDVEKRVYLLREFGNIPSGISLDLDVPDPIGKPAESYEECLLTIKDAIEKIVKLL